ncbi:MAG: bifunctional oligoribonuclease/PAP phosphatase NrnA [Phycisphaerae bacterium]
MTTTPNGATDRSIPEDVVRAIDAMCAPIMISHVVPDADALGSMFAMARSLASDRCQPKVSLPAGSLSKRLSFMFDWAQVEVASETDFSSADGFIALDTAKKPRCNIVPAVKETDWSAGKTVINLDHHATNTAFGTINWIAGDASSTCEMVGQLLLATDRRIDAITASLLYAGIQTDTLGFSLPTTGPATLKTASRLAALGAKVGELGERTDRNQTQAEFNLLRTVYANTKAVAGGRIAYSSASHDEIRSAGCTAADIDDQINIPRSLNGVVLAMLFTEGNPGKTRINFRGSGDVTVVELAGRFGGGGHAQAAGAILSCPLEDAIAKVLPEAEAHLKNFA